MKKKILSILLCAVFTTSLIMGCAKNGGNSSSSASEEIEAEGGFDVDQKVTYITPISILNSKEPTVWFYSEHRDYVTKDMFPKRVYIFQKGSLVAEYYTRFIENTKDSSVWLEFSKETNWPTYGELSKMSIAEMIKRYESLDSCSYMAENSQEFKILSAGEENKEWSVWGFSDGTGNNLLHEILGYKATPPQIKGSDFPDPYYYGLDLRTGSQEIFPIYDAEFIGFNLYYKDGKDTNYESYKLFLTKAPDENTITAMDELGAKGMVVDPDDYKQ